MTLSAVFFKGDRGLEDCLVKDSAHILLGSAGDHVSKIQSALTFLDNAKIESAELFSKRYGKSTAAAVLAYKNKRGIINFTYQKQADNIVGKMTIARLDSEMLVQENRLPGRRSCGVGPGGGSKFPARASSGNIRLGITAPQDKIVPKVLKTFWHRTANASTTGSQTHFDSLTRKAGELLLPFGMLLSHNGSPLVAEIPFHSTLVFAHTRAEIIRKLAESVTPNVDKDALRVIVCRFDDSISSNTNAFTSGKGFDDSQTFNNYILLNDRLFKQDGCTLLHEMIHAATSRGELFHDTDNPKSVFANKDGRNVLTPVHALELNEAFFAS